ncbi:MAG: protein NO VEIN domain-containing protein [Leptospirillum sp.]
MLRKKLPLGVFLLDRTETVISGVRFLGVPSGRTSQENPFFISRNECATAIARPSDWRIYRVHLFAKEPRIFTIVPPLEIAVNLRPETWRASF